MSTPEAQLVERLRTDVLWHKRRHNETIAADCQEAADAIERLTARSVFAENDAATLRMLVERLTAENANLRTVMIAAAEEIQAHWAAHCDAEGYGPANLMRRLEDGIPAEYGYTAGAFARLTAERDAIHALLPDELFAGSKDWAHGDLAQRVDCLLTWLGAAKTEFRVAYLAFERVTAERDALVRQNLALCDAMGYSARKHELDSPEEHAARLLADHSFLSHAYRQVRADADHRSAEIAALAAERDALRADAARLDWFNAHILAVQDDYRRASEAWLLDSDVGLYRGNTIREAIDNAMRAALQQPKEPSNG